jgi:hypothetical protein
MEFSRRKMIQGSVATLAGAGAALPAPAMTTKKSNYKGCFYFTELLGDPAGADTTAKPASSALSGRIMPRRWPAKHRTAGPPDTPSAARCSHSVT